MVAVPPVETAPAAPAATPAGTGFRPDIQGLRAFAVLAVVLYHLFPARVPGGFVGVDVFFVISGFLITQHLVREAERTGRIALTAFWARRIRRLLPAALLVLACSAVLLVLTMPRLTWDANAKEIAASAAYVQNWLLGHLAVDYLASEGSPGIAQHYWSLSVEEQFYLGWPLLLLTALACGRRLTKAVPIRTVVSAALSGVLVVSLGISVLLTRSNAPLAFFATHARAWEFAAGGLLALSPLGSPAGASRARAAAAWAGLAAMTVSLFAVTVSRPFPGWVALLPVTGAVLFLAGGASTARWSSTRLAGIAPLQWLGDQSYSVYLWHWPLIIALPWALHGDLSVPTRCGVLVVTLLLAYLTKRGVEDPFRTSPWLGARRWPAFAFAAAGLVVLVGVSAVFRTTVAHDVTAAARDNEARRTAGTSCFGAAALVTSCGGAFDRPSDAQLAYAVTDVGPDPSCQVVARVARPVLCRFGELERPTRVIAVVGNSHAMRVAPALAAYGKSRGWQIVLAAKTDCLGLTETPIGKQVAGSPCLRWTASVHQQLLALPRLDAVVFQSHNNATEILAGPGAGPAEVRAAQQQVLATWSDYRRHGAAVLVLGDVPGTRPVPAPECIARSGADVDPCARARRGQVSDNLMTTLAQSNSRLVAYQALMPYVCDQLTCHAAIGSLPVYSDSHHLTGSFSRSLAPYLGPRVEALLR